jgi:hypothetical protein
MIPLKSHWPDNVAWCMQVIEATGTNNLSVFISLSAISGSMSQTRPKSEIRPHKREQFSLDKIETPNTLRSDDTAEKSLAR